MLSAPCPRARSKPTKNDARGIAEMMRLGHYRPVICAQNDRHWMEHWPRRPDIGRRLMTIPGVGPVTTLAYIAAVDDPGRFGTSKAAPRSTHRLRLGDFHVPSRVSRLGRKSRTV